MYKGKDNDDNGPSPKKRRSNNKENNQNHVVVAMGASNKNYYPDIYRLNVDCFEDIFDYLSLEDLAIVGQISKRIQRVVGHYFRQSYVAARATFHSDFEINYVYAKCFIEFVQKIRVIQSDEEFCRFLQWNHLESLKQIRLYDQHLTRNKIECMKQILSQVEAVELLECKIEGDFFESLLVFCSNMKRLCVDGTTMIGTKYNWLHRNYPTLEHFQLLTAIGLKIDELKAFFELNPNIKKLAFGGKCFWVNQVAMWNCKLELEILEIKYDKRVELDSLCPFLNELHRRGLFKQLHVYFDLPFGFEQEIIDHLATVDGLVKLVANSRHSYINISSLIKLEELCITSLNDLEHLPDTLTNLKRLYILEATSDDILPFIRRATKLTKIKVNRMYYGKHFEQSKNILDLPGLNEERGKLAFAKKIMIYVKEDIFLATKWSLKQTEFSLIEMKRTDSIDWEMAFQIDRF
ncbi:uncharacterized protein LOC129568251 [Sitodiplosis mosellana]|uniref:uncharacterized protein LOC129568251 n=1 Tax=Sitodiplosis mosellana TaxID=263140 RepID=UPI002444D712|nr:uncharacterized protein LOC129568251 [Sitodiplosis mosellana]